MDKNLTKTKSEMLARADEAVKKVASEFTESLKKRVTKLEGAVHTGNKEEAVQFAYDLESEAETFGWPRVTRICKWFRKILSGDYDERPKPEEVFKALTVLKLMVSDPDNPDEERDTLLFKDIYPSLQRAVSDI